MKHQFDDLAGEAKLRLLRDADTVRTWRSLDDTRHCVLCEQTISGRQIRISWDRRGTPRLNCPTRGCPATPAEWVHPENPLISEDAWKDWVRLLDTLCDESDSIPQRPNKRFRPRHQYHFSSPGLRLAD